MSHEHHVDEPADVGPDLPRADRSTAPQSAYTTGEVGRGLAVLVVGLLLTYGLALAL